MAIELKQQLKLTQQLVMTPQLQQAIKLLQMSNFELQAFVDAEVERNPLLEREESGPLNYQPFDHFCVLFPSKSRRFHLPV